MSFVALVEIAPDLARRETRTVFIPAGNPLPEGEYGFLEMFCDDEGCDCRRAFIQVWRRADPRGDPKSRQLATISYGWEDENFYRRWARGALPDDEIANLKGPALESFSPQSQHAPELLRLFQYLLEDPAYARRIVRHAKEFRAILDARRAASQAGAELYRPHGGRSA